jgi:two-component system KDP operon response regulator KdpE
MNKGPAVLIIDDEIQIQRFLRLGLEPHSYTVSEAQSGEEGIRLAASLRPDLVILDLSLPDMDGLDVLKNIRTWSQVPIIVLSVRNSEHDKVELLDAGANDYITKPFGMSELLARMRSAIRHSLPDSTDGVFTTGNLSIDFLHRKVTLKENEIKLTPTEYSLLSILARHAGKVITHSQIHREIWGPKAQPDESYLRVYVLQLRRKIEEDPSNPKLLITESGIGYRLVE